MPALGEILNKISRWQICALWAHLFYSSPEGWAKNPTAFAELFSPFNALIWEERSVGIAPALRQTKPLQNGLIESGYSLRISRGEKEEMEDNQ